jgi:recombination associated protein RdgC
MWFKNLHVYRFTQAFTLSSNDINLALEKNAFTPSPTQQPKNLGWVTPLNIREGEYVFSSNGCYMMTLKRQEKILPASVVNEHLIERVQLLAAKEHRKITRNEKLTLKEDIIFELLPKAFTRTHLQFAYIDTRLNMLIINSSSETRAEEFINALREAVGSLPVIPLSAKNVPTQIMSHWLLNNPPQDFTLGEECELTDTQESSSKISCRGQNLFADEIHTHVKSGMVVTKLGIEWNEKISCVINDKLAIKKLKFSDLLQEQANNDNTNNDDAAQQFDADFAIMTAEISAFITALMEALGGEQN